MENKFTPEKIRETANALSMLLEKKSILPAAILFRSFFEDFPSLSDEETTDEMLVAIRDVLRPVASLKDDDFLTFIHEVTQKKG